MLEGGGSRMMPLHLSAAGADRSERALALLIGFAAFTMSMHVLRLGPINVTVSDAALVGCLVLLVTRQQLNHVPFGKLSFAWCAGLSLMLGGLLVSSVVNGDPLRWINVAAQYLFAWLLLPMVLFSFSRERMQRCTLLFVYGVAASQAFSIAASYTLPQGTLTALFGPGFVMGNGRLGALTGEGNWNGAVIAFAFPMLINAMQRENIAKWSALLCIVFMLWGLVACASFTGFGATAAAVAITIGITSPRRLFTVGLPLAGLVVAYLVSGLPLPGIFEQRVAGALTSGDLSHAGTFAGRSHLIVEAWKLSSETILLGFGVDRYREVSTLGAPVHQFFLLILTEGSAFALCGLLMLMTMLWVKAVQANRVSRSDGANAVAVLVVFCIFTSAVPHMYTRLWIGPVLLALAAAARQARPQDWIEGSARIVRSARARSRARSVTKEQLA